MSCGGPGSAAGGSTRDAVAAIGERVAVAARMPATLIDASSLL
jgi:hypothetical protein